MLRFLVLLAIIWLASYLLERALLRLTQKADRPNVGPGRSTHQAPQRSAPATDRLVVCTHCQVRVPAQLASPQDGRWICRQCADEPPAARRHA